MIQPLSKTILSLLGWHLEKIIPDENKMIIIGAPHTSNWDFPLTLLALSALGLRFSWVGKHTLFKWPFGIFLKAIGGIPVNRKVRNGFINEMVNAFAVRDRLILAIAPEGTRSKQDHWKGGFYRIATKANIKICFGFIDYPAKKIGLGHTLQSSNDIDRDFEQIKTFYHGITGKHPHKASTICLREKEIALLQNKETNITAVQSRESAT